MDVLNVDLKKFSVELHHYVKFLDTDSEGCTQDACHLLPPSALFHAFFLTRALLSLLLDSHTFP